MSIRNQLLEEILLATTEGTGAGFLMPDSATYPFASDSARDTWGTANKEDLVKNSTVVNVSSTVWYVWRGEDSPASYDSSKWSDVTPIIKGEKGDTGEKGETGGVNYDNLTAGRIVQVGASGADLIDSPIEVDAQGKVGYITGTPGEVNRLLDQDDRVTVDGNQTPSIQTGTGLESTLEGGTAILETSGVKDIVEYNVDADATITLGAASAGKFISITQTTTTAKPMAFTFASYSSFELGDTIKIGASESYVNYFFSVFYSDQSGQVLVVYPDNNCEFTKTADGWDAETDGTFTKTAIVPSSQRGVPLAGNSPELVPVQGFTFIDHPALSYIYGANGERTIQIDLNQVTPPAYDTVDIAFWWSDSAVPLQADIINSLGQPQSALLMSKEIGVSVEELHTRSFTAKREEGSFKYAFFAWPANFFDPEPTKVETGFGSPSSWNATDVDVSGTNYKVLTVEITNNVISLEDYGLVQEGSI
jgi:hypothetical protein